MYCQGVADIGQHRTAQHDGALKHHGLAAANLLPACLWLARPADGAGSRLQQAVAEAHEQAFAGAVGAHDDGLAARAEPQIDGVQQRLPAVAEAHLFQLQRQQR